MKAGIMVEEWKRDIYERHLTQSGYTFTDEKPLQEGIILIGVITDNVEALQAVLISAGNEARRTGQQIIKVDL